MGYIYKITNQINQKSYIGKTTTTVENRWKEHKKSSQKEALEHRPLYSAIRKYGIENFTIEEIENCSNDILSEREKYWIKYYNTYGNTGYNATLGGDGVSYVDYKPIVDLFLIGNSLHEIKQITGYSFETITKAIQDSGISKEEISKRGHEKTVLHSDQRKEIIMLDKNSLEEIKVFPSIAEAGRYFNKKSASLIARVANDFSKTAYGYKWKIVE